MNNLPFSGPPSSLPLFEPLEEGLDAPSRTREERNRMEMINRGVHHRLVAHRAIEEARRANVLMWACLLLCIPSFVLGCYVTTLIINVRHPSLDVRGWVAADLFGALLAYGAGVGLGTAKRLVSLSVERFGKSLWE